MSEPISGRRLMAASLAVILALNLGLSALAGTAANPAVRFGRPAVVALTCILVWQGRGWARLLLVLLSLGVVLAGPISLGNGLSPLSVGGVAAWLASVVCGAALGLLYFAPSIRAAFATARAGPSSPAGA
jgi:hypothetical protein